VIETALAHQWLYQTLSGDATLQGYVGQRVYRDLAPQGAAMPYLVFSYQAGRDVEAVGAVRILSQITVLVRVWGRRSEYATLAAAATRVDELLHAGSGTNVLACVREFPIDMAETVDGVTYVALGGQYRLLVQA